MFLQRRENLGECAVESTGRGSVLQAVAVGALQGHTPDTGCCVPPRTAGTANLVPTQLWLHLCQPVR